MEVPFVSILMTAYNREKYIADAIESALASTYTNFELIIVDDGSADNTVSIAKKYAALDKRIRLYVNQNNLGDYHNRNKAASYATGKYLKYLDSDDLIYPHGLEVMVRGMEQFPEAGVGIVSTNNQDVRPYPFLLQSKEAYELNFYKNGIFHIGPTGLIFRTEDFRQVGGFSGKRFIGDTEINLKLAARGPVVLVGSSLVYWRIHTDQEYVLGNTSTGYLELFLPMLEQELTRKECPLDENQVYSILAYYRKTSARQLMKMALRRRQLLPAYKLSNYLSLRLSDFFNAIFLIHKKF